MIDLYFGSLSPARIGDEIRQELIAHKHFNKSDYLNFIHETAKKYKIVYLSDGSAWTLLAGRDTVNYVHIHPARGSKFTKRVNAIACKTAILIKIFFEMELMESDLVSLANCVRHDFLDASPVKSELGTRRLKSILDLL